MAPYIWPPALIHMFSGFGANYKASTDNMGLSHTLHVGFGIREDMSKQDCAGSFLSLNKNRVKSFPVK